MTIFFCRGKVGQWMYKRASSFMQAMSRRAAANSKPTRTRTYRPPTRPETRQRWYSVIEQHHKANTNVRDLHDKKRYPVWLEQEVRKFGPERWLAYWDSETGLPTPKAKIVAAHATADEVFKEASKRRQAEERGREHYDALIREQRCQVSPLAAALQKALDRTTDGG